MRLASFLEVRGKIYASCVFFVLPSSGGEHKFLHFANPPPEAGDSLFAVWGLQVLRIVL